ncbi:MAG: ATP-dependent DNA helicase RecG [Bacteroidetes bacterium]|nr:ATP-dependent DNA helicase RecG [Bacteroidota bacterium]
MSVDILETPIEYLKGVGPQRADLLKKEVGIFTFKDLLHLYPFRYIDRSKFYFVKDITEDLPYIQLKGYISNIQLHGGKRTTRMTARFSDSTGIIELIWFKGFKWLKDAFKPETEYIVFGKPNRFGPKYNIAHPEIEIVNPEAISQMSSMQPVYSSTEKLKAKGLDSRGISKLLGNLIPRIENHLQETLNEDIISQLKLLPRKETLINIHFPEEPHTLNKAIARLKFEELFFLQLSLLKTKTDREIKLKGYLFKDLGDSFHSFFNNNLPFELTNAQKKVLKEIRSDTLSGKQMNRLLQGDVGSGKTIVAVMTMLMALDNGFQACIMAPTEILAQQHYKSILKLLNGLNISIEILTGSTKQAERRRILGELISGKINILIGTHALIEEDVSFKNLGIVVIDEQHRFGVAQRAKLWEKTSNPPHVLVMTATPIPRTLAMTLYGDLDVSVIDELPPGRKAIKTIHQYDSARLKVFGFMKEQIKLGRQIYVVYPLIKESEKLDLKFLEDGYESIVREFPLPKYIVSIVHGKLKTADKEYEMQRFVKGESHIMVATTVIEVGIDVPNASVMIIESAERFGLSQLHQLRGRVGRGADQSYCILMTGNKLSNDAKQRIQAMVNSNDGFEIAEMDLKLRGPGDIQGTQQSGIVDLKIADIAKDEKILKFARDVARNILEKDPELSSDNNKTIAQTFKKIYKHKSRWSRIS